VRDDDNAAIPFLQCNHKGVQTLTERGQISFSKKRKESNLDIKMIRRLIDHCQSQTLLHNNTSPHQATKHEAVAERATKMPHAIFDHH